MGMTARKRVNAALRMTGRFFLTLNRSAPGRDNSPARVRRYRKSGQFTLDLKRTPFRKVA